MTRLFSISRGLVLLGCLGALTFNAGADPAPAAPVTTPAAPTLSAVTPSVGGPGAPNGPKINLMHERVVRARLRLAGVTDASTVAAVLGFVRERDQARATLQKLADDLAEALSTPNLDSKKLDDLYGQFGAELDEERERTLRAEKELDNRIHFSRNNRLAATLLLAGVVGDAALFLDATADDEDGVEDPGGATDGGDQGDAEGEAQGNATAT